VSVMAAIGALMRAALPVDPEFAAALARRWAELPETARTPYVPAIKERPVPTAETAAIDVSGVQLITAPGGQPVTLGTFSGVQILVLLRHRH
jgi:hypothetical protein